MMTTRFGSNSISWLDAACISRPVGIITRLSALLLAMALLAVPLQAHQQKSGLVRILFNANTGNLELMHRYYLHDAEHVTSEVFGTPANLLESSDDRELFASYVRNRFAASMVDSSGGESALELSYIGQEMDGLFIWIYQEIPVPGDLRELVIFNSVMKDIWPDQSNMINIEREGVIQTLDLSGPSDVGRVNLAP